MTESKLFLIIISTHDLFKIDYIFFQELMGKMVVHDKKNINVVITNTTAHMPLIFSACLS